MTRNQYVSQIEFVAAWQASATAQEAAHRLGISTRAATVRAFRLRRQGVPLKPGGRKDGIPTRGTTARPRSAGRPCRRVVALKVLAGALA